MGRTFGHVKRNAVAYVALFVALGGTGAYAASSLVGGDGTITACVVKKGKQKGTVRIAAPGTKCGRGQQALSWSQRGPAGPAGVPGERGPQGPPGSDAQFNGAAAGGDLTGTYPSPSLTAPVGAHVSYAGSGNINPNSIVTLDWAETGARDYDVGDVHKTASTTTLTAPKDGRYAVAAQVAWNIPLGTGSANGNFRRAQIRQGPAVVESSDVAPIASAAGELTIQNLGTILNLHAGDALAVTVGYDGNLVSLSPITHFEMTRLGPAQ